MSTNNYEVFSHCLHRARQALVVPAVEVRYEHNAAEEVVDLDPHRTVTYLDDGVPHCYMGHPECYDRHTSERLADESDWLEGM